MQQVVKLFMNGRSQAVRLPARFRFDCKEVYIRKDPDTGDVVLSEKPADWSAFLKLAEHTDVPEDFMADRDMRPPEDKELF